MSRPSQPLLTISAPPDLSLQFQLLEAQVSVEACSHEASSQGPVRVRLKSPVFSCPDAELVLPPSGARTGPFEAELFLPGQMPAFMILEARC